jgi:SM-20-related protein
VVRAFEEITPELVQHFDRHVSRCEEPQFLRYQAGDYFVAHQDGNTGLIFDDSRFRLITAIIFVNDDFGAGELVLHNGNVRSAVPASAGTLVAFPAETTHEVVPITSGERYTIVTWYR